VSDAVSHVEVDPFDLPEWLGEGEVTWSAESGLHSSHRVRGVLRGADHELPCDLLAVDEAYPSPVAGDATRLRAHQAWRHGQVQLASYDGRLTLLTPGRDFSAEGVLDVVGRLAKAVGAAPEHYAVLLRLGR
jgi:hypothetical protein